MSWTTFFLGVSLAIIPLASSAIYCPEESKRPSCNKFACQQEPPYRGTSPPLLPEDIIPVDEFVPRKGRSFFEKPCKCDHDWNAVFCDQHRQLLLSPPNTTVVLPTVCICRELFDDEQRCSQFMTRCFLDSPSQCRCCFNQKREFCNQIACSNDKPIFSSPNMTCACFKGPAEYPTGICEEYTSQRVRSMQTNMMRLKVLGVSVSTTIVTVVVIASLVGIAVLTTIILIAGNRKMRSRKLQREQARAKKAELLRGDPNGTETEAFLSQS